MCGMYHWLTGWTCFHLYLRPSWWKGWESETSRAQFQRNEDLLHVPCLRENFMGCLLGHVLWHVCVSDWWRYVVRLIGRLGHQREFRVPLSLFNQPGLTGQLGFISSGDQCIWTLNVVFPFSPEGPWWVQHGPGIGAVVVFSSVSLGMSALLWHKLSLGGAGLWCV